MVGVCPSDPGGVGPLQRHLEALQRPAGARQALQALRHEEVPEQRQQGDETTVSRQEVQYPMGFKTSVSIHCMHSI